MKNTFYTYREAQNSIELVALLKLRYKVFYGKGYVKLCPKNQYGINLDPYDLYSRHFGFFKVENGVEKPVGYMRVVQKNRSHSSNQILKIAEKNSFELVQCLNQPLPNSFPLLTYFNGSEIIIPHIEQLENSGLKMCEASRFAFSEEIRSLQLARFVTECSIAIYRSLGFYGSIITCSIPHSKLYEQYGFKQVSGTGIHYDNTQPPLVLLSLNLNQDISLQKLKRIDQMSNAYKANNAICYHPNKPNHFLPPQTIKIKVNTGKVIVAA